MRPIVLKVLKQEPVSQSEWQDLFYGVHLVCLWDEKGATKIYDCLQEDIVTFIKQAQTRVLAQREEQALLKAYIIEWRKFFTQSSYLPLPFRQLETGLLVSYFVNTSGSAYHNIYVFCCCGIVHQGRNSISSQNACATASTSASSSSTSAAGTSSAGGSSSTSNGGVGQQSSKKGAGSYEESLVRKLMLDSWNQSIFCNIKRRLQDSAMKLVHAERNGDAFDSQLVIGVRESYVNLCSSTEDKLKIYRDNFEASYLQATTAFYRLKASEQLQSNGVQMFMRYADTKLREEEARAQRYLEPSSYAALTACCVSVLIGDTLPILLAECAPLIKADETDRLQLMFRLLDRVADGVEPMLADLEAHIVYAGLADMLSAADVITQDSEKYVERLLELFRTFSGLVRDAFADDPRFLTARDKAFKTVVNDVTVFKVKCLH